MEEQRAPSRNAWPEAHAVACRPHETDGAHRDCDRRLVPECVDQRLSARMAPRSGPRRFSLPALGQGSHAWDDRAQPRSPGGQHALAVHQPVLARGQARCQRRPRDQHRQDLLLFMPMETVGWTRRGKNIHAQLQGKTRVATTFAVALSMDRGPLDTVVHIVHAGKTRAVLPAEPFPPQSLHTTSEKGWATTSTIVDLAASRDHVMNPEMDEHGSSSGTWRQRKDPGHHRGITASCCAVLHPAAQHVVPAVMRRGGLPQLQGLHQEGSDHHA